MWSMISRLLLRVAALRWLFKLGGLGLLLPIAFLLKMVGLPLLMVLGVLAIPVLILLFVFGLPIFLVLIVGSMLMGLLGFVLTIGIAALKVGIFIVLPIWLVCALFGKLRRRSCKRDDDDSSSTPPAKPPSTEPQTEF
ncbi:MAG TPA: hypothetical protein VGM67_01825 [Gemmatimonadaceae bacterium]|jgi:hypothetical protein